MVIETDFWEGEGRRGELETRVGGKFAGVICLGGVDRLFLSSNGGRVNAYAQGLAA